MDWNEEGGISKIDKTIISLTLTLENNIPAMDLMN